MQVRVADGEPPPPQQAARRGHSQSAAAATGRKGIVAAGGGGQGKRGGREDTKTANAAAGLDCHQLKGFLWALPRANSRPLSSLVWETPANPGSHFVVPGRPDTPERTPLQKTPEQVPTNFMGALHIKTSAPLSSKNGEESRGGTSVASCPCVVGAVCSAERQPCTQLVREALMGGWRAG
ncbi:uncharacterized protein LOC117064867 [Trachypithecus francoisi]|uniref:uncharacterized protein LOC117064867 n=1 Tax=Trachypithecus francoisi TaxID=54180 RepID=UPI00141B00D9|nr:uncharacterized protein LOC117064867 [Trachypithecus francoisi]